MSSPTNEALAECSSGIQRKGAGESLHKILDSRHANKPAACAAGMTKFLEFEFIFAKAPSGHKDKCL